VAETREKNQIKLIQYRQLIEDSFFHPQSAFEALLKDRSLRGVDLLKIHILLTTTAPLFTFLKNLILVFYGKIVNEEEILVEDLFSGVIKVWIVFIVLVFIIRFVDIFRLYYKFQDRTKSLDPPPPWVFMIGFIPFSGSGVFLILPTPVNLVCMLLAFFYSLQISYYALMSLDTTPSIDFQRLFLMLGIFLLILSAIILLFYNIYRMVQS